MDLQPIIMSAQSLLSSASMPGLEGLQLNKETWVTLGYACYLYIMMDRFNVAPSRRRRR